VPRADGAGGSAAVACDCGMQDRATRVMDRAANSETLRALRFRKLRHGPHRRENVDGAARAVIETGETAHPGICRGLSRLFRKRIVVHRTFGRRKNASCCCRAERTDSARGTRGLFCDYRELLKEIQASYNPASESTGNEKFLEPIRTVEILVLDDLGASKPSDWVRDIVGIVLNAGTTKTGPPSSRPIISITLHGRRDGAASERQADFADARKIPWSSASDLACAPGSTRCAAHRGSLRPGFSPRKDAGPGAPRA